MKSSTPLTQGNQATLASQKYQKAIKEINKLILINTTTKKELISLQEKHRCLQLKYSQLQQQLLSLGKGSLSNQQQKDQLKMAKDIESIDKTSQMVMNGGEVFGEVSKKSKQAVHQLTIPNKSLENTGTISEFADTKRKFQQYEQRMAEKDLKIEEMMKQLGQKNKENSQLYEKCIELMNRTHKEEGSKLSRAQVEQIMSEKVKRENQLKQCKQQISQLNKQISLLRKREENMLKLSFCQNQKISNQNSRDQVGRQTVYHTVSHIQLAKATSVVQEQARFDPFPEHYARKIQELEGQIIRISKQFESRKNKYKTLILNLRQENEKLDKFAKKQQSFIEEYVSKNNMEPKQKGLKLNKSEVPFQLQVQKIGPIMQKSLLVGSTYEPNSARQRQVKQEECYDFQYLAPSGRVKTMQSEQSPMKTNKGMKVNVNLSYNNKSKHRFMEGTKHYNNK